MTASSRADELNLIDGPGVAHILRVTLLATIAFAFAVSAFTLLLRWRLTPQLALVAGASALVALLLSRSGRIRLAMMLPLLTISYAVLHLAARSDGIQNIGLAILPVLIMLGSLVLDRLRLVLFTAGIILAVGGMLAIRYFVLQAERYSTNDMGDLFIFALTCATAALVGRLLALQIKEGFQQAQAYCQALGVAERNVRLVADSLSEMVLAYDMQKNLTYANSGAEKLTGYGLAELQVAQPLSWVHPGDLPQLLALWDKVFDGHRAEQIVYRLMTQDGTVKWVAGSWGPVVDEAGRQIGIRGTCQDITERVVAEQLLEETTQKFRTIVDEMAERKRAEQALRESEERFRNMADTAPVMLWVAGPDKSFTFVNKTWLDFTGRTLEQELGNGWTEDVHPEDLDGCFARFSSSFDARQGLQIERRLRRADGEYRWVFCTGVPRFEPGGVFAGYIGSDIDITEQKRAAQEIQRKFGQLQVLFDLAGAVSRAQEPSEIYRAAVQGLVRAVGADRASVLIFDPDDVMRFKAWTGLSDEYRVAVEGHTPWRRGVRDAEPIAVADVMQDPSLSAYRQVFAKEGIRAVAFIPLLAGCGKTPRST